MGTNQFPSVIGTTVSDWGVQQNPTNIRIGGILEQTNDRTNTKNNIDQYADNQIQNEKQLLASQYIIYPADQVLSIQVNTLFRKIKNTSHLPDVQIYEDKHNSPNAFIFPDGQIYISRWLLDICEYEEEILAVLAHEIRHHKEEHFVERTRKTESKKDDSFFEQIKNTSGLGLLQEWRADIGWLIDLDNSGINPYWAAIFFKKLSELQRRAQNHDFSFTHGSSNDRFLNTLSSARLYDFEHISEVELTPFSSKNIPLYANSKVRAIADMSKILSPYPASDRMWFDLKKREMDKLTIYQTLMVLPQLKSRIEELYGPKVLNSSGTTILREDLQTLLKQALNTLENSIFSDNTFSVEEQSYIFGSMVELYTPDLIGGNIGFWEVLFQDIRWDLEDILIKLDVITWFRKLGDYLHSQGLFITKTPENFTKILIKAHVNAGTFLWADKKFDYDTFLKFIEQYSKAVEDLCSKCATRDSLYDREGLIRILCTWVIGEVENESKLAKFAWENFKINIVEDHSDTTTNSEKTENIDGWELQFAQKMQEKDYGKAISILISEIESTWECGDNIIHFATNILDELKKLPPNTQLKDRYDSLTNLIAQKLIKRNPLEFIHIIESLSKEYPDKLTLGDILFTTYDEIEYLSYTDIKKAYDAMFSFDGQQKPHWDEDALNQIFEDSVYILALRAIREENSLGKATEILKAGEWDRIVRYNNKSIITDETPEGVYKSFVHNIESGNDEEEDYPVNTLLPLPLQLATEYLKYIPDIITASSINHLWQASKFFQDKTYQEGLQKALMDRVLDTLSFEDGFVFVFDNDVPLEMIERFIDIRAKTHEQIERCKQEVLKKIQFEGKEGNITDYFIIYQLTEKRSKIDILFLALWTGEDDMALKTLAFNDYHSYVSTGKDIAIECEKLYMMSETSKHILLRTLLTGKWGVLEDKEKRQLLLKRLAEDHIQNPDGEIESEVLKIFSMLLEEGKTEDLYFIFSSILQDRIFRRPKKPRSYLEVINRDDHIDQFLREQMWDYRENFWDENSAIERDSGYSFTVDWVDLQELLKEDLTIKWWYDEYMCDWYEDDSMPNDIAEYNAKVKIANQALGPTIANPFSQIYSQAEALCGGFEYAEYHGKMDATTLIVNIARQLGSIGIRFLQIMGQYVEIPEYLRGSFNDVYDNINGQSKIVAHTTLLKAWPEFKAGIQEIGECIGWGSITTVYVAKSTTGENVVLKVVNPSFKFQYEKMFATLLQTFQSLAKSDAKYETAIPVIHDIKLWIENDVSSENFIENDAQFYKKWNGWKNHKKDRYSIRIPKSLPPGSEKFKQEEFIEWTNLTKLESLQESGHDIQAVIRIIIAHYIAQIKDGIIHSDAHAGNFRITANNEIAILDRSYYLEIGFAEKVFLRSLFANINNPQKTFETLIGYLAKLPWNENVNFSWIESSMEALRISVSTPMQKISDVLVLLRKNQVYIPLWMTLLLKNINALYDLANKVGISMDI